MNTWNRAELKQLAKQSIRKNLFYCVGICLATSLLTTGFFGITFNEYSETAQFYVGLGSYGNISLNIFEWELLPALAAFIGLLSVLYSIFIAAPISVGQARFFIENRTEASRFEALFYCFRKGCYINIVKTIFLRDLYITLWTFLFVIPGIYKAYQYAMIPYILAENPTMPHHEVLQLTKELTNNNKLDMFILDLSFIGWYIACAFTCGIGYFFLAPYIYATGTELYIHLRDEAIRQGIVEPEYEEGSESYVNE